MTPRMSWHARQRCQEMGISTKVAKRIVANAEVRYPGTPSANGDPTQVALWTGDERYAVVYAEADDGPVVLTVLFKTLEFYERAGTTFIVKEA